MFEQCKLTCWLNHGFFQDLVIVFCKVHLPELQCRLCGLISWNWCIWSHAPMELALKSFELVFWRWISQPWKFSTPSWLWRNCWDQTWLPDVATLLLPSKTWWLALLNCGVGKNDQAVKTNVSRHQSQYLEEWSSCCCVGRWLLPEIYCKTDWKNWSFMPQQRFKFQ